jgi:citrate lyase subunit alpha/citrate CoA-transferase
MQAGAGGTSLAIAVFVHQILKNKGWKSKFGFGGSTKYMVKMLEEGQMGFILDAQVFDLDSVRSIENNPIMFLIRYLMHIIIIQRET